MPLSDFFPRDVKGFENPRQSQLIALNAIDEALRDKVRFIAIEAPTGSGKSGIAVTLARYFKDAVIITPSKSLQDQYLHDFPELRLMKGRSSYPCTFNKPELNKIVIKAINTGAIVKSSVEESCAKSPCVGVRNGTREKVLAECGISGQCPYDAAIHVAIKTPAVVFNNFSYVYQTYHAGYFSKRRVMILDEAHGLDNFLRGMLSIKFSINRLVDLKELSELESISNWISFLNDDEQYKLVHKDNKESYLGRIEKLQKAGSKVYGEPVIYSAYHQEGKTRIEIIPSYVGGMAHEFLFNYADTVVLMSGTLYSKEFVFGPLGVKNEESIFIRLPSDFPKENRAVVLPRRKDLDLSHKNWDNNLKTAISDINDIVNHHNNQKGLIHTVSYRMNQQLVELLNNDRIITHSTDNFAEKLSEFYNSDEPKIFISPIISQGVDFKDDLARWQIIIRPSYPMVSDPYIKNLLDKGLWNVYNYKALVVFGQQLGRVVRSNTDYGVTYLLSSSFMNLISKSNHLLPLWQKLAFVK